MFVQAGRGAVACNYLLLSYADKGEMLRRKKWLIWVLRGKMHVSVKLGISFQTLPSECYDNENNVSGRSREGGGVLPGCVFVFRTK